MQGLLFLDTETTGNNILTDRLFQVCYSVDQKIVTKYFKPTLPISVKSQSITHITNKMIADKPSFTESKTKKLLQDLLQKNILVAHNAVFDIAMLASEGLEAPQFICTLKVARTLDEECTIPEYNLQYLRYFLEIEVDAPAHDAKGDVIVLEALFKRLYEKMLQNNNHEAVIAKMLEISSQPFLFKQFTFGKYKGKKIEEVATHDKNYLEWLLTQKSQPENVQTEEDWIYTLKHYLKR